MFDFSQISIDTVYTSQNNKNAMNRLKGVTGIKYWNTLCRYAFCISIKEGSVPRILDEKNDGVEMNFETFAGKDKGIYTALLANNLLKNNIQINNQNLAKYLRAHISRGINILFNKKIKNILGFFINY
jgi:DNA sulfur modification protein DndE